MSSIKEVAGECGVSTATVSRILNNNPRGASAETRERVHSVARRLGYQPSAAARGLRSQRMNTLGIVRGHSAQYSIGPDPHFAAILDGMLAACGRADQRTLVFSDDNWKTVDSRAATYCDGHCDGFLLVIPRQGSLLVAALLQRNIPFIAVGNNLPGLKVSSVAADNVRVGLIATRCLLEAGHRRIAHLCGSPEYASSGLRLQGYRQAIREAGLPDDESLVVSGEYTEQSGYENTRLLMRRTGRSDRPTALVCADDWIALGALRALAEMNCRVPQDVSVIGVNDGLEAATASPPLTTVRLPLRQIGEKATEMLLAQIQRSQVAGEEMLMPVELIIRATVGNPNGY